MTKCMNSLMPIMLGLIGVIWGVLEFSFDIYLTGQYTRSTLASHLAMGMVFSCLVILIYQKTKKIMNKYIHDLHFSKERYRLVLENSPVGIAYYDFKTDEIFDYNQKIVEIFGSSKEKYLNLNIYKLKDGKLNSAFLTACSGQATSFEEDYISAAGNKKFSLKTKLQPVNSAEGNCIGVIGIVEDISAERKAENALAQSETALRKSEEQYRVIFENCPLGFIHLDQTGVITHSNEQFVNMVGATRDRVIGFNMFTEIRDVKMKAALETAVAGQAGHYEGHYTTITGGKTLNLKVIFNPIISFTGEFLGIVGIHEDISEKKKFEEEMARLDRLNMVGQIASGIGHEVRNPMTTVRGFLQLLAYRESDDKKKEYYCLMMDELDRANSIITEFLSLARDRHVELQNVSLNMLTKALYPLLNADAMEHDNLIVLEQGDIPPIPSSEKEMRQLIINLVRNALEASPPREAVIISTYLCNGEVVLSVEDKGMGIPPEIHDRVGTPFFTTKDNGTGLGLSICYSIAHKHNGKIDFKTGSSGTTFYVRFKEDENKAEERLVC